MSAAEVAAAQAASIQYQMAHLDEDRSGPLRAVLLIGLILSTLAVVLRLYARRLVKAPFLWDDWTIIGALILNYGLCVCKFLEIDRYGLGTHAAAAGPEKLGGFMKALYAYTILYMIDYPLIKLSILFLYHRVFVVPEYLKIIKFWIVFVFLFQVSFVLVAIFPCQPIHAFWDFSKPSKCVSQVPMYIANSALNIFTDVVILVLPMPIIWKLQVSRRQKSVLCLIFVLGSLVLITTIMRIVTYLQIDNNDPSWSFIPCATWTMGEIPLAIVCACLPTMRPLFHGVFRGVLSKISTSGSRSSPSSSKTGPFIPLRNKRSGETSTTEDSKGRADGSMSSAQMQATSTEQLYPKVPMVVTVPHGSQDGYGNDMEKGLPHSHL
ncbi:MAG: hypothetical protein M1832_003026 [Thelocarpon impressellum]|nr:MAG: hypothetical protein M1832_003026 [Thelocarpon impressellum]